MTLTLTLKNVDRLDNGESTRLVLDRHGAVIGRSPHADWSLPDPKSHLSSTHCEIDYRDGAYLLVDKSTNGTFINGGTERLAAPHPLAQGDEITAGPYRIAVQIAGGAAAKPAASSGTASGGGGGGWNGWGDPSAPAAPPASDGWGSVPAPPAPTWGAPAPPEPQGGGGWGTPAEASAPKPTPWGEPAPPSPPPSQAAGWGAPTGVAPSADANPWGATPQSHAADAWGAAPPPQAPSTGGGAGWGAQQADPSDWNAPIPTPAATGANPWGAPPPERPGAGAGAWGSPTGPAARAPSSLADSWGSLPTPGAGPAAPTPTPFASEAAITGAGAMSHSWSAPSTTAPAPPPAPPPAEPAAGGADVWGQLNASVEVDWARAAPPPPPPTAAPPPAPRPAAAAPPSPATSAAWEAFLAGSGVKGTDLKSPEQAAQAAGATLKRLIAGLVVMLEARMRAKAQLGAASTALEFDGNNPLKFVRDPDKVLTLLMNPPERGFMNAERAVDDAFVDLQAHQMATLAAMQGALRSTLERFSPAAIRARAETRGLMAKILPGAKNAALWDAYEREFEGVAHGSDEAFMDVFAKAFKTAYEESAARMKRR